MEEGPGKVAIGGDQTLGFQEEDAIASDLRRVSDAGGS